MLCVSYTRLYCRLTAQWNDDNITMATWNCCNKMYRYRYSNKTRKGDVRMQSTVGLWVTILLSNKVIRKRLHDVGIAVYYDAPTQRVQLKATAIIIIVYSMT